MGVVVEDATRVNNCDPTPPALRFASAVYPPHKGPTRGRVGWGASHRARRRARGSRRFHFNGISSSIVFELAIFREDTE